MVVSLAVRDTSVILQSFRASLAVVGIRHLAVLMGAFASADVPAGREINEEDDHQSNVDQEQHGHSVVPHCGLHLPRNVVQHATSPVVVQRERRILVAGDAVSVAGTFAGQARVVAFNAERTGLIVILDRVSPQRTLLQAAAVAVVVPVRLAH